jgi:hypothetical protein
MGRLIDTQVQTVNELITADHLWNEEKARSIFLAPDADAILQIPMRRSSGEDWLAWTKEKSGLYPVRSAYRAMIMEEEHNTMCQNPNNTASSDGDGELWKKLWKISSSQGQNILVEGFKRHYACLLDPYPAPCHGR